MWAVGYIIEQAVVLTVDVIALCEYIRQLYRAHNIRLLFIHYLTSP
jgi:hypothetical protein